MKKLLDITLLSIGFLSLSKSSYSQSVEFQYNTLINGYWREWKGTSYKLQGTWQEFVIFKEFDHPSNYIMKITISYLPYDKKEIKKKLKNKEWFVYTGTVEYFVCTGKNCKHALCYGTQLDLQTWPVWTFGATDNNILKKIVPATIKMNKPIEKKGSKIINIFFDNQGIGIAL